MANFNATADIDMNTNTIDSVVDIEFLKDYSKVINKIPLLGYILIGNAWAVPTLRTRDMFNCKKMYL